MKKTTLLLVAFLSLTNSYGQIWKTPKKIIAKSPKAYDKYGVSLGINKDFYFIGSSLDDESVVGTSDETKSNGGAVYIYKSDLSFHQKLFPSKPMKSAYFGNSLSVDDSHLVIGSYYGKHDPTGSKKEGLVYLFKKDGANQWKESKILKQTNGASYDLFGRDVAIHGDYVLVTANGEDETEKSSGAAYIFFKNEGGSENWGQQAKLKAKDVQKSAYLGWSGDLYGDYAVLGAYRYDTKSAINIGAAYVFKRNGTNWIQQTLLLPKEAKPGDSVGYDVAIYKDIIVISAPNANVDNFADAGLVFVYERDKSDTWKLTTTLKSPGPQENEVFGHKVAVSEHKIVVTAKGNNSRSGKVYVFTKHGKLWQESNFKKANANSGDNFGTSVAVYKNKVLIGSDEGSSRSGAAYLFESENRFNSLTKTNIQNFFYASLDWGDYDNDGKKDLIISGGVDTDNDHSADVSEIHLYKNKGNGVFEKQNTPSIYGLHLGAVKFADIDNDGDQDIITCGQNYKNITKYYLSIYENKSGNFVKKQDLDGVIYSSLSLGDYDNNGTLDLLVTGAYQAHGGAAKMTRIYTNTNGTFTNSMISLPAVQNGNAEFVDIDTDGDLDILIMGSDKKDKYILKTFANTDGEFKEKQSLPGMYLGSFALGDYDADGDLDFAIMGDDTKDDYAAKIYKNTNGEYTEHANLKGIDNSSGTNPIQWADYDNDGDLDLVFAGTDADYNDVTVSYKNTLRGFKLYDEGIHNLGGNTSLGFVDYDQDNDVDIVVSGLYTDKKSNYTAGTFLHENYTFITNKKPSAPKHLKSTVSTDGTITFSWGMASDDFTLNTGLSYELTVGTSAGKSDIASYKVYGTTWSLKGLKGGQYHWSVKAIDAAAVYSNAAIGTQVTLSTQDAVLDSKVSIYPNPVQDHLRIEGIAKNEIKKVVIFSIDGKKVYTTNQLSQQGIDVSQLSRGIYIVQLLGNNQSKISRKIVKK